jgi:membrane fusion protein, multidrug efflux system
MKPRLPSRRVVIGLAAALPIALLAGVLYLRAGPVSEPDGEAAGGAEGSAWEPAATLATDVTIPVEGAEVISGPIVLSVSAAGQAAAWRQTVLLAQVPGAVAAVRVRESDAVAAGAPLLIVDPADHQLALREARARYARSEAAYRELTLFDERMEDAAVRAERDRVARAKSGVDADAVAVERAERELARTRLVAPFAGRIATLRAVPGQWLRAGDELMTLVQLDPIKVEVQVLEAEVGHVGPGHRARVSFAAFPGEVFEGRVETVNPIVERDTRTARVTVRVPNPGGRVLPGMYARVALDARRFTDRTMVPRAAILERDRRTMLFVYEGDAGGGRAKWRYVTTGLENDELVEIVEHPDTDMVRPGEVVLTGGHYTLIHDARVRVVESAAAAGGRPR